jgi:hypothetical protein
MLFRGTVESRWRYAHLHAQKELRHVPTQHTLVVSPLTSSSSVLQKLRLS